MEILKPILKDLISQTESANDLFKRNLLKEYLQVVVLEFIYSQSRYSDLVFYGGSCLAHCFGLPRLSEDLDFVDEKGKIKLAGLASDLENYFSKNTDLPVNAVTQKFRIYLKFPLLQELGLSRKGETDLLFLKVEIFSQFNFCRKYKTEIRPFFKFNRSILIKTFELPTLMSTKIRAVLQRKWEKTDKQGKITAKVKGRDYFDLLWYLERGIKPNLNCLKNFVSLAELRQKLIDVVSIVDAQSIRLDLEALIDNKKYIAKLNKGIKEILLREIKEKL